jgi:hypothetical protein
MFAARPLTALNQHGGKPVALNGCRRAGDL